MVNSTASAWIAASAALAAVFATQFVAENYRRFKDGSALAGGIAGELSSYKGSADIMRPRILGWMAASREGKPLTFRPFERPVDMFFDEVVGKIGLLGPALVEHTVYVYANLRAFRMGLEIITTKHAEMSAAELQERCSLCLEALGRAETRGLFLLPWLHHRANQSFLSRDPQVPDGTVTG